MQHPSRHLATALILVVVLSTVTLAACGDRTDRGADGAGSSATSSAGTGSANGSGTGSSGSGSASGTAKPLTPKDADALEQQLDAIERELDGVGMPSDSDFEQIEDSLK